MISTFTDLRRLATSDEREMAYHASVPDRARECARAAARLRAAGEHVGAGMLERDAAALIRMAHDAALCRLVAARLLTDVVMSPAVRQWLTEMSTPVTHPVNHHSQVAATPEVR